MAMIDRIVRLLALPEDSIAPTVFGGAHRLTEVRQFSLAISRATKRESLTLVNHWGTRSTSDISYFYFFAAHGLWSKKIGPCSICPSARRQLDGCGWHLEPSLRSQRHFSNGGKARG